MPIRLFLVLAGILLVVPMSFAAVPPEARVGSGVAIIVPLENAQDAATLANDGRVLVHGLAADEGAALNLRQALRRTGFYGVASISDPPLTTALPFADHLASLIVVDLDALPAGHPLASLGAGEIGRVLAPGGVAWVRSRERWDHTIKPRPPEMDDWTHFDHDAAGTGLSSDHLVGPPTNLQWWSETQEYIGLGGNPAGYRPYTAYRVSNGRIVALYGAGKPGEKDPPLFFVARDAFNGVPLWKIPGFSAQNGTAQEYQFVVEGDRIFTFLGWNTFPVAINAATGKVVRTFENAARLPARNSKVQAGYYMLRAGGGLLVETAENRLIVLDAASGEVKWTHHEKEDWLCFPRLIASERRLLVQAVEANAAKIQGRWANLKTSALLCFDLADGKLLWRSTAIADNNWGQTIWDKDRIFIFNPAGIGAAENWGKNPQGSVACLSARDGTLLWRNKDRFTWGYNLLVREGRPFFATPDALNTADPATGEVSTFWKAAYNNRCNRTAATPNYIIMGLGIFVDQKGVANVKSIARSGCAQGAFPACGLTYFTPNTCTCFTQLRGHLALSSQVTPPPLADHVRITRQLASAPAPADAKPTDRTGPIAAEWAVQFRNGAAETPPVALGDRTLVAVIHEHRLECRKEGRVIWSFAAGARISQPPIVAGDRILLGAHDGYAYCLNAADGAPVWRFLAAPAQRFIVAHGQIESMWPVYNVALHDGYACLTAGLHPELGGGIHAWGLNVADGSVAWHKVLKRSEVIVPSGKIKIAPNRVLNSPLTSDGKQLSITGLTFSPTESDADIQTRIDQGSLGDRNRNLGWTIRETEIQKR